MGTIIVGTRSAEVGRVIAALIADVVAWGLIAIAPVVAGADVTLLACITTSIAEVASGTNSIDVAGITAIGVSVAVASLLARLLLSRLLLSTVPVVALILTAGVVVGIVPVICTKQVLGTPTQ